jgi:hypothetical protein
VLVPLAGAVVVAALGLAGWSLVAALRGVRPSRGQLVGSALVEALLVVQALLGVVLMLTADREVEPVTFLGYHLTAVLLLPVGVAWGIADRSRWGNGVLAVTAATEAVLVLRLLQIWGERA